MSDRMTQEAVLCTADLHEAFAKVQVDYDVRAVLGVLLAQAASVAQAALSVGVLTPSTARAYFDAAWDEAMKPREKPATLVMRDGATQGRVQ